MHVQLQRRVIDVFRALDTDEDGKLSRAELHRYIDGCGITGAVGEEATEELDAIIDEIDVDADGSVTYAELYSLLRCVGRFRPSDVSACSASICLYLPLDASENASALLPSRLALHARCIHPHCIHPHCIHPSRPPLRSTTRPHSAGSHIHLADELKEGSFGDIETTAHNAIELRRSITERRAPPRPLREISVLELREALLSGAGKVRALEAHVVHASCVCV